MVLLSQDVSSNQRRSIDMRTLKVTIITLGLLAAASMSTAQADELAPYGTAKVDMHEYPTMNAVFDVNYEDPNKLNILNVFVTKTSAAIKGKVVVVTHGPELRVFAKENYVKYQGIVDKMAALSEKGVEFRMCNNAMRAAGFKPEDMHGFITVVPAGFPEIAYLQSQGYKYINPAPLSVKDARYIEQPQLKGKK
jgi:intracellular sulfur oxidation DsrE/DsrF family protein